MAKFQVVTAITMVVLTLLAAMIAAGDEWGLGGRKFHIVNVFPFDGLQPCPVNLAENNNSITFFPSSSNPLVGTVEVVGELDAANIYVCNNGSYEAAPPGTLSQYFIYGNFIRFQNPNSVAYAVEVGFQKGQLYFFGLSQDFDVSLLTPAR